MTADIRIPRRRPDVSVRGSLGECTAAELAGLALAEGGLARTSFTDGRMAWSDWIAFQPYDKWPEPGELRRIGDCLIEFAPSGVYVEDWRFQPAARGLLAGLELIGEVAADGGFQPRGGGLVVASDLAILVLGRRRALPGDAPLDVQFKTQADTAALAALAFDASACLARLGGSGFTVELATNPFDQGASLHLGGFQPGRAPDLVEQTLPDGARRLWRVETLLPRAALEPATKPEAAGSAWLVREATRLPRTPRPVRA